MLIREVCAEVAKVAGVVERRGLDEGLKALSASVVTAAPDDGEANTMRALVLSEMNGAWEAGPRTAADLKEVAMHFGRAAALCPAPAIKASLAGRAAWCRGQVETIGVWQCVFHG